MTRKRGDISDAPASTQQIATEPDMPMPDRSPWGPLPPQRRFAWRLLLLVALAGAALLALVSLVPPIAWAQSEAIDLVRLGVIGLMLLLSAAASRWRLVAFAGGLAAWALVALLLVALYGYRFELKEAWSRVAGELLPTRARAVAGGSIAFARASDQHFRIDALVDGQPLRFLLDTGASAVVLSRQDAIRLGFVPERLSYTQIFETANGRTRGAPVRLKEVSIGPIRFTDVPASVNEGALGESLLGMRLLEQLSSIEIKNDTLLIRQ
jgi:aspartyl protease family protein